MATSKSRTKAPGAKKKATRKAAVKASNAAPAAKRKRGAAPAAEEAPSEEELAEVEATGSRASGKRLVIVESPTKSKTLNKFLGKDFMVLASNGHVMDLPKSQLGVDIDNNFEPEYVAIRTKNQALGKIRAAAKHAAHIYLAPDPDREGEAIAWHLQMTLKGVKSPVQRLTFNEITQRAVTEALEHPRDLDMNLVNAQQARRVLDRLVLTRSARSCGAR